MGTLQTLLEEQLAEFPRLIATEIVRDRLAEVGKAGNDELLKQVVEQLLGSCDLDRDEEDSEPRQSDIAESADGDAEQLVLTFTEEDVNRIGDIADRFLNELPTLTTRLAEAEATKMLRRYRRDWRAYRPYELDQLVTFRRNLEARWGCGFDALRMLLELCRDIGTEFHQRAHRSRSKRKHHLNCALSCLHVRACQIAAEILTLIENGFADGAMARWRTLHEVSVVANVLADGGDALAERYLMHEAVEAKRAMDEYARCHEMLGHAPLAERTIDGVEREFRTVIARFGVSFREPFGWAADYLSNPNPKFYHLEAAAGKVMMRSYYKMASYNVHASPKGIAHRLGSIYGAFGGTAGATNVGFVEPGQHMLLTLLQITVLLLPKRWDLDTISRWVAIMRLRDEVPGLLAAAECKIKREEFGKAAGWTARRWSETQSHRCVRSCPCEDRLSEVLDRHRLLLSACEVPRDAAPSDAPDRLAKVWRAYP